MYFKSNRSSGVIRRLNLYSPHAKCVLRASSASESGCLPPPCHPTLPTVACSPLPGMWHATLPTLALLSASHLLSVISYLLPGMIWQCGVSPSIYQMGHVNLPTLACPSFPGIIMSPLSCHQLLLSWQCNNVAMWQYSNVACIFHLQDNLSHSSDCFSSCFIT